MYASPAVMRRLMRELGELQSSPPEGIRVVTSEDNMLDVTGIIEGPEGTPYAGGYFRVKQVYRIVPCCTTKMLVLHKNIPPNVSSAGEICVNTLKKGWKSSYGIAHILITIKCLLVYPNPESALDEEAGKLLLENYEDYCGRAKLITSVHATPRVKPAELGPVASSSVTASSSKPTLPASSPSSSTISPASTTATAPGTPQKCTSPAPPSSSPAFSLQHASHPVVHIRILGEGQKQTHITLAARHCRRQCRSIRYRALQVW